MQALPQLPQLETSCSRSTQDPSQDALSPQSLPHVPLSHTSPAAHFLPQAPQLSLLEPVSTHCPAHIDKPSLQAMPHLPAAQTAEPPGPAGQTLPQPPQLLGSASKLRHTPAQTP